MKPDAIIKVRFKTTAEGGRQGPIVIGEKPYGCPLLVEGEAFDCRMLVNGQTLQLGNTYELPIKFVNLDLVLSSLNFTRQPMQQTCHEINAGAASRLRTLREEGKLIYVTLNIPAPCPPRSVVPVHQERGFASLFHLSTPGSLSVRDATAPAMSEMLVVEFTVAAKQN